MSSSRVKLAVAAFAVVGLVASPQIALGIGGSTGGGSDSPPVSGPNSPTPTSLAVTQQGQTIEALLGIPGSEASSSNEWSDAGPLQPRCGYDVGWAKVEGTDEQIQYRVAGSHSPSIPADGPGPNTETWMIRQCPPGAGGGIGGWVMSPEAVDMQMLINSAVDSARARIPTPSLNMSPAPEIGSVVNLGLWLAVDDPGQAQALTSIGPVWAAVTARFVGTTWDMGDETVVRCDGTGTPYLQGSNQIEQGPCGHTYKQSTPESEPYTITVTAHFDVRLTTSDGRDESLDPMESTYTFAYDVDEIITVGTG